MHFVSDYPIMPQIQIHILACQPTYTFNFIRIHSADHLGIFCQMAVTWKKYKFKMSKKPYIVENSILHLHLQFHANPTDGFETIGFKEKFIIN